MARRSLLALAVVACASVPGVASAQILRVPGGTRPAKPPLPDLIVTDLKVDSDCHVVATLANAGGGRISETVTSIGIQFYRDRAPAGGWAVSRTNGLDSLRQPGGTAQFTIPSYKLDSSASFEARVDDGHFVTEAREDNNVLTRVLSCAARLPDLTVRVGFAPDCTTVIEVANVGQETLHAAAYTDLNVNIANVNVERSVDGIPLAHLSLATIDPGRRLMTPGAAVQYKDAPVFRAYHSYGYAILYPFQEARTDNNRLEGRVPAPCAQMRPKFDLRPVALALDQDCRVKITIRNDGPGEVPPLGTLVLGARFLKAGAPAGEWLVDLRNPLPAGAEVSQVGPVFREATPVTWAAVIDASGRVPETNEANNNITATLRCQPPPSSAPVRAPISAPRLPR